MTWRVITGDSHQEVRTLGRVQACVTCPPYFGSGLDSDPDRYVDTLVEIFREVAFILDGPLHLILGDGKHRGMPWTVCQALQADGWQLAQELVWAKHTSHDHIFLFNSRPLYRRTVLEVPPEPHAGTRFATLPEALLEPLILAGSREGDTVLDPFAGSGTSGIVATRLKRDFVGVEIEASSADWARHRIAESQPSVITP